MLGLCHICKETKELKYCPACEHWFCADCRSKWFWRGYEAVLEIVKGKQPGCCGPLEDEENG